MAILQVLEQTKFGISTLYNKCLPPPPPSAIMKSLTECQRVKIYMLSVQMLHSFNDECGVCISPQKLDQCMKSRIPMYAFNILLRFKFMVRIVESTHDACTIKQVLVASDKHKDLYTVLLHKQLGNIVFRVNKTKENWLKELDHQMCEPACQITSHTGLIIWSPHVPIFSLKWQTETKSKHFDMSVFAFLLVSLIGQIDWYFCEHWYWSWVVPDFKWFLHYSRHYSWVSDHYAEIMFIVFGRDISFFLQTREISLHKNNSHDLHIVITHRLVLGIVYGKVHEGVVSSIEKACKVMIIPY